MSTKAPGEILELFRGGYLSVAETIDALDAVEGYVSVELLNIEQAVSDDLREQNAKLRKASATPAVGGEPLNFPYQRTFDAICAAVKADKEPPFAIHVSVKAFQDAFNNHRDAAATPASPLRGSVNDKVREIVYQMSPADQYDLAFKVAENVGYMLVREPEHPDSPHLASPPEQPDPFKPCAGCYTAAECQKANRCFGAAEMHASGRTKAGNDISGPSPTEAT